MDTPLSPPPFLGPKNEEEGGERRREGEKEEEKGDEPPLDLICEEREYSILPVMSGLSTVRCDRTLGLWIAGT